MGIGDWLGNRLEAMGDGFSNAWEWTADKAGAAWDGFTHAVTHPIETLEAGWNGVVSGVEAGWQGVVTGATAVKDAYLWTQDKVATGLGHAWDGVVYTWNNPDKVASAAWGGIKTAATAVNNYRAAVFESPESFLRHLELAGQGIVNGVSATVGCIGDLACTAWDYTGRYVVSGVGEAARFAYNGGVNFLGLDGRFEGEANIRADNRWTIGRIDSDCTGWLTSQDRWYNWTKPDPNNPHEKFTAFASQAVTEVGGFIIVTAATAGTGSAAYAAVRGGGAAVRIGRGVSAGGRIIGGTYEASRATMAVGRMAQPIVGARGATALARGTSTFSSAVRMFKPIDRAYRTSDGVMTARQLTRAIEAGRNVQVIGHTWRIQRLGGTLEVGGAYLSYVMNKGRFEAEHQAVAQVGDGAIAAGVETENANRIAAMKEGLQNNLTESLALIEAIEETQTQNPDLVLDPETQSLINTMKTDFEIILRNADEVFETPEQRQQAEEILRRLTPLATDNEVSMNTGPRDLTGTFAMAAPVSVGTMGYGMPDALEMPAAVAVDTRTPAILIPTGGVRVAVAEPSEGYRAPATTGYQAPGAITVDVDAPAVLIPTGTLVAAAETAGFESGEATSGGYSLPELGGDFGSSVGYADAPLTAQAHHSVHARFGVRPLGTDWNQSVTAYAEDGNMLLADARQDANLASLTPVGV